MLIVSWGKYARDARLAPKELGFGKDICQCVSVFVYECEEWAKRALACWAAQNGQQPAARCGAAVLCDVKCDAMARTECVVHETLMLVRTNSPLAIAEYALPDDCHHSR